MQMLVVVVGNSANRRRRGALVPQRGWGPSDGRVRLISLQNWAVIIHNAVVEISHIFGRTDGPLVGNCSNNDATIPVLARKPTIS